MALQLTLLDGREHDRASFSCGNATLDDYLRRQANQRHRDGIATTHVLIDEACPARILGYCSLSAAQLHIHDLQPEDRQRLPTYPVPALRVGRLAVARDAQGRGHGSAFIGHAVNCALALRNTLGVRVVLVDAKDERAASFYASFGFRPVIERALTLYLSLGRH